MRHLVWVGGVVLGLSAGQAGAGLSPCDNCSIPTMSGAQAGGDKDTTEAFAGINWAFGSGPELVVGVRSLRVNQRHRAVGARLEATFPFSATAFSFDKLRLRLVGGHRKGMYELGGGYSFAGQGFLLSGALQADYVNAGTDFTLNTLQWQPFVGVNTLGRPKAPTMSSTGAMSCADPQDELLSVTDPYFGSTPPQTPVNPGDQLNGFTCVSPV
jgi:hypothetical protein